MGRFLDSNGVIFLWEKIKTYLSNNIQNKVDKVDGKGLSTHDLTDELYQKLLSAGDSSFSGNYEDLTNIPTINGKKVSGTLTLETLGIQASEMGKGLSTNDFTNAYMNKLDSFQEAGNYALKSDITTVFRFRGSVNAETSLPSTGQTTGDVYNIIASSSYGDAGTNVVWDGERWDSFGEGFTVDSITNEELGTILV